MTVTLDMTEGQVTGIQYYCSTQAGLYLKAKLDTDDLHAVGACG